MGKKDSGRVILLRRPPRAFKDGDGVSIHVEVGVIWHWLKLHSTDYNTQHGPGRAFARVRQVVGAAAVSKVVRFGTSLEPAPIAGFMRVACPSQKWRA